jgi:uncharacterized protein (TIGR03067 family)
MDNLIRFQCPKCGKVLKAPPNYVGRFVRCARPNCNERLEVPEPLPADDSPALPPHQANLRATPRTRRNGQPNREPKQVPIGRRRRVPVAVWGTLAFVAFILFLVGAGYWLFWVPSSEEEALYKDFIRSGNELVEIHLALEGHEVSKEAVAKLEDKAREHLDALDRIWTLSTRKKKVLDEKYQVEMQQLRQRWVGLLEDFGSSKLTVIVLWQKEERKQTTGAPLVHLETDGTYTLYSSVTWTYSDKARGPFTIFTIGGPTQTAKRPSGPPSGAPKKKSESVGKSEPPPSKGKRDPALEGDWRVGQLFKVYTGRKKDELSLSSEYKISIHEGQWTVSRPVDGKKTTVKYDLELDPTVEPKRFKITNPANADDFESGIYRVEKDTLLIRTENFGKAAPEFKFSGAGILDTNDSGQDSDIPKGFLRKRGDKGAAILRFVRVGSGEKKEEKRTPMAGLKQQIIGMWVAANDKDHSIEFLTNGIGVIVSLRGSFNATFYDFVSDDTIQFTGTSERLKLKLDGDQLEITDSMGKTTRFMRGTSPQNPAKGKPFTSREGGFSFETPPGRNVHEEKGK